MSGEVQSKHAHVGINLLFIVPGRNRGVQTYVDHLLEQLLSRGKYRYTLFVSASNAAHYKRYSGCEFVECPVDGRRRVWRVFYEQLFLSWRAKKTGCKLLFFPGYLSPVWKILPFVVTIPDTQFRDIPHMLPRSVRILYELIVPRSVKKADEVITISEFSKERILNQLSVVGAKVTVGHLAAGVSKPEAVGLDASIVFKESGLEDMGFDSKLPFLISVSSANKHKNIAAMIDAFCESNKNGAFQLVLVGAAREDCPQNVFSTGFLSNEIRDSLYRFAHGYVFASKYEGFGLPLLEAMEADIPIASSSAASLPEVGGDACIYFDPDDHASMVSAISRLCNEADLRRQLVEKGRIQRAEFSWDLCAAVTEAVFAKVLQKIR